MVLNRVRDWAVTDGIIFKAYYEPHYDEVTIGRITGEAVVLAEDKLEVRAYFESLDGKTRTPYTNVEFCLNPEKEVQEAFDEISEEVEDKIFSLIFSYLKSIALELLDVYSGGELCTGRIMNINKDIKES